MAEDSRRRNIFIALAIFLIILLLLLWFSCKGQQDPVRAPSTDGSPAVSTGASGPSARGPGDREADEVLTPATLKVADRVVAGAAFTVVWTGPNNRGDYLTIVRKDAPADALGNYRETKEDASLEITAPLEPGDCEVRYVTGRSHTILGRAPVKVTPAGATLDAAADVTLGAPFTVTWTGPNNKGDYITVVAKDAPDAHYGSYVNTDQGSPLKLTAPTEVGDAEVRYVAAQGRTVLARRAIRVLAAAVMLSAPADAVAGTTIEVAWKGPDNANDYITVVPTKTPDGEYGNYTLTSTGSPLKLLLPIMGGGAEIRYITGQGNRVLGRREIKIRAAQVSLSAPADATAATPVEIKWTGPNNPGDYITVVPKGTPDGEYKAYTLTTEGSPLRVKAPDEPGESEIRYMTGQGNKVLARSSIKVSR